MKNIFESMKNSLVKKSFFLELETLDYPKDNEICDGIEKYAKNSGEKLEFISKKKPIKFRLDDKVFIIKRGSSRGGPTVYCLEE